MEHQNVTDEGSVRATNPGIALDPSISQAWKTHFRKKTEASVAIVDLVLPSTLPIKVMRMPLSFLFKMGLIPDPITTIVQEHIAMLEKPDQITESMLDQWDANPQEAWDKWHTVLKTVWMNCVVQPSFTDDEAQAGEDSEPYFVGVIDELDMRYVYQWAQGVDQSVADFLHEQAEIMARLSEGDSVSEQAKRILRDRQSVASPDRGQRDVPVGIDGGAMAAGNGTEAAPEQAAEADHDGRPQVQPRRNRRNDPRSDTPARIRRERAEARATATGNP